MFYDHFTQDQVCGIFTPTHIAVLILYYIAAAAALYGSRRQSAERTERTVLIVALVVTAAEIVKIALRLWKGESGDAWIPLYFSSLFLYAIWLSLSKNERLRTAGNCFLAFGGTVAGAVFIVYPSTSLPHLPIWHPGAVHSIVYHWLMLYVGVVTLMRRYVPEARHFWYYFLFVTVFSVAAAVCNAYLGTNLMFLGNPYGLPFLQAIYDASPWLYLAVAYLAQAVLLFWVCYGVAVLIRKRERKTNE